MKKLVAVVLTIVPMDVVVVVALLVIRDVQTDAQEVAGQLVTKAVKQNVQTATLVAQMIAIKDAHMIAQEVVIIHVTVLVSAIAQIHVRALALADVKLLVQQLVQIIAKEVVTNLIVWEAVAVDVKEDVKPLAVAHAIAQRSNLCK